MISYSFIIHNKCYGGDNNILCDILEKMFPRIHFESSQSSQTGLSGLIWADDLYFEQSRLWAISCAQYVQARHGHFFKVRWSDWRMRWFDKDVGRLRKIMPKSMLVG